jgi:hypothetical protein
LDWRRVHERVFPAVALSAQYLISSPTTSVASERVFSGGGHTVAKMRARVKGYTSEKYVVLTESVNSIRRLKVVSDARHVE